jgi:hypothetical protein
LLYYWNGRLNYEIQQIGQRQNYAEVEVLRKKKLEERGGFGDRIILKGEK